MKKYSLIALFAIYPSVVVPFTTSRDRENRCKKHFKLIQNNAELIEPELTGHLPYIARYHHESNQLQFGKKWWRFNL
jgi:hypothetical protein